MTTTLPLRLKGGGERLGPVCGWRYYTIILNRRFTYD
jgi:hypothetical protein